MTLLAKINLTLKASCLVWQNLKTLVDLPSDLTQIQDYDSFDLVQQLKIMNLTEEQLFLILAAHIQNKQYMFSRRIIN